jgi:subtilisin family serine protease
VLKSSFNKTFAALTATLLSVGCFVLFAQFAQAEQTRFVIQLTNDQSWMLTSLPGLQNVKPVFPNSNYELANTYSFETELSKDQLQQLFGGLYNYLDAETIFTDTSHLSTSKSSKKGLPNDPGVSSNPENIDRQWGLHKANFIKAWEKTTGSKDVVVAVVDTGIDATHEDFSKTKFIPGYNVLTAKSIPRRSNSDDNGHGTLISGVIAATTNNEMGIAGAAYGVSLMPIKALDDDGTGTSSDISEAIVWAADHDADVINLSLGGIGFAHDTVLANAISYAFGKNVVIVAAAGK